MKSISSEAGLKNTFRMPKNALQVSGWRRVNNSSEM